MPISVVEYDHDWARRFDAERALLERVLAPWLHGGVHHVGSTAVPGLAAKPIIDMVAGVRDLARARAAFEPLGWLGYAYSPHRPRAYRFSKPPARHWWECTHHLHLTEPGGDLWRERLAFRDALRGDAALRADYQGLKLRLAQEHGDDITAYTAAKRPFVARVLARAGIDLPDRSPPDPSASPAPPALPARADPPEPGR
ncbi:MAG TPA: GrpB family protein [Micromonosporaceae bacterium]|nr:GrpB family protein [Micromonosporaceae bacterium]